MIRCIVFDFDGTLVQSNEIKHRAYFDTAAELSWPHELVESVLGMPGLGNRYGIITALIEMMERELKLPDDRSKSALASHFADRYGAICEAEIAVCPEVPGAMKALKCFAADGYTLYVNSATPDQQLNVLLHHRGFENYLAGAFGSDHSKAHNLLNIMRMKQFAAREIMVVGDGEDDRASAAETGCHFVGVELGGGAKAKRFAAKPRFIIDNFEDLAGIIGDVEPKNCVAKSIGGQFHD